MDKNRIEAFSDGVLAIIITIMVLELKVPHGVELAAIVQLVPVFMSYCLSFIYVGIYWNNHHHMFKAIHKVNGVTLWANLFLLFWLSLLPFTTGWMGENHFAQWPVTIYGINLLLCALAYFVLQTVLIRQQGPDGVLARAIGKDIKGKISPVFYLLGCTAAWLGYPAVAIALFVFVAMLWLVPDRRVEHLVDHSADNIN
ncbi:MAG TPA: TMEM175 family protein [Cellvibrionaceae bacterium]